MSGGLRIALAGASGALAREVLSVIDERGLSVAEILPFATEASVGQEIEFQDDLIPIRAGVPSLRGVDLLLICTPRGPARDLVREALRAEVFCIDCSGALAGSSEVPLLAAELCPSAAVLGAPLISSPTAPALAWSLVLAPLARAAGLERVLGTVLKSASHVGRAGIEVLSSETLALLSQQEVPESAVFPGPVAFDCLPAPGPACEGGETAGETGDESGDSSVQVGDSWEAELDRDVRRLVASAVELDRAPDSPGADNLRVGAHAVQVPTFVSEGSTLAIQTERPLSPAEAGDLLEKAAGVKLWDGAASGPSTRDAATEDEVLVSRLRRDPSADRGLLLWAAADPLRLAAGNAVKLAETRLRLN